MKPSITKIRKDLSGSQFLKLVKDNPTSIKSSTVVPPKLGSGGFGKIRVEFK